jgi:hypothetical protein
MIIVVAHEPPAPSTFGTKADTTTAEACAEQTASERVYNE